QSAISQDVSLSLWKQPLRRNNRPVGPTSLTQQMPEVRSGLFLSGKSDAGVVHHRIGSGSRSRSLTRYPFIGTYFLSSLTAAMRDLISSVESLPLNEGIFSFPWSSRFPSTICFSISASVSLLCVRSFTPSFRAIGVCALPSGPWQDPHCLANSSFPSAATQSGR